MLKYIFLHLFSYLQFGYFHGYFLNFLERKTFFSKDYPCLHAVASSASTYPSRCWKHEPPLQIDFPFMNWVPIFLIWECPHQACIFLHEICAPVVAGAQTHDLKPHVYSPLPTLSQNHL